MASLSSTRLVSTSSGHARPSCVQLQCPARIICFRLLSSSIYGDYDNATRLSISGKRIRFPNGALYSNWTENRSRRSIPLFRIFSGGFKIGQDRTSDACPLGSCETSIEDSSSRYRGGIERVEKVRPRLDKVDDETSIFSMERNGALRKVAGHVFGSFLLGTVIFGASSADATDALKTCSCLLKECRVELARCIADPSCAANIACLQTCNNRPDETQCQIGCGDLFENQVVDQFNDCAVSRKGCVPQKQDEGDFPIPPPSALSSDFRTNDFAGKWYITSGLNKTFDTFDCQVHEFSATPPNKISGKLAWRIPTPDGGFFTRSAVQNFVQDGTQPGILYNHDNVNLHYKDDWYILASSIENSPNDYVFVYYRGSNDAWDGYGGAVVYTRSSILPPSIIPKLTSAAKKAGLDFSKFTTTNNSCEPEPPLLARLEKKAEDEERVLAEEVGKEEMFLVQEVKQVASTIGRFFANIVNGEINLFNNAEEQFLKELGDEERALFDKLDMDVKDIEALFGKSIPIRNVR